MTEDELLAGIGGALDVGGWLWHHDRRSDQARQQGTPGFPDIVAVHPVRRILWVPELKTERGDVTEAQWRWLEAIHDLSARTAVIRPSHYDEVVRWLAPQADRE